MKKETLLHLLLAVLALGLLLCGCTTNITSNGSNARFELSPARNIYPNTSVMNGLSLIPKTEDSENVQSVR